MRRTIHQFCCISVIIFICTSVQGNYSSDQSGEGSVSPGGLFSDPGSAVFSMDIKDEPLKEVLERISDQNNITFLLPPSLAEEKVMMRFSDLTLEEVLNKILSPYNHIFIYRESQTPSKSPRVLLEKVRIFPYEYEGRVKEPLMSIAEGASVSKGTARSEGKKKDREVSRDDGRRGETYIGSLTSTLKGRDREAKLDAVEVLKDAGTVGAVRALSVAMRDRDPRVKNKAVSALKAIGEDIVIDQGEADDANDPGTGGNNGDNEPAQRAPSQLRVGLQSGDSANIALSNPEAHVKGVQFKVGGAQVTEVQTTARTQGFLATFNEKNGKVILTSLSGETIAPGNGPIAKIIHSGGRVSISDKIAVDK